MPEASYLLWIDFAGLGLEPEARKKWLHEQVRLFLSPGLPFGASGTTFERLNFGTARPVLDEALKRLTEHAGGKAFV